jgi:ABC-type multidrug transport system fused ATPase/permease subunit
MYKAAYYQLWSHISAQRRNQIKLLLALMVITSFAEILSIGAVLPFLAALMSPERVFSLGAIKPLIKFFDLASPHELLLPLTLLFVSAAFLSGALRLLLLWRQTRIGFSIGADLSLEIYKNVLYQNYSTHVKRNSSQVVAAVTTKINIVIEKVLLPFLRVVSSTIILIAIMAVLIFIDYKVALTAFFVFSAIYALIAVGTKRILVLDGKRISHESSQVIKIIQEGLGGIRDVLIDGLQEIFCRIFRQADLPLRRSQANLQIIGGAPRFLIESFAMASIATLAYCLVSRGRGLENLIPVLGSLALGAQRMLPVIQQLYYSLTSMRGAHSSLQDILKLLNQKPSNALMKENVPDIAFERTIRINQVSYQYVENSHPVISKIDIEIPKGSRVGIKGTTGSGKSTLVDILMGLLMPTEGFVSVDGVPLEATNNRSWQKRISHVPQSIFLVDASIAKNIAFGVPDEEIDYFRLREAACKAQIADTVESLPLKYETVVGEGGFSLSGGQRQRVGIARALYKNADVIFLDEATSALDSDTEHLVIQAINSIDRQITVIMVAHRLSTLNQCDLILELEHGKLKQITKLN